MGLADAALGQALGEAAAPGAVVSGAAAESRTVAGVRPRFLVEPTTVSGVSRVLALATARGLAVVPTGRGTRLHWGAPPQRLDVVLSLAKLDRVLAHEPADLTLSVEGGATLSALNATLDAYRQFVPLDPAHPESSTVGGLIATGAAGPYRARYGTMRDLLLGVTVVRGDGTVVKGGGRVVKNVAGFDLVRLTIGAWGTLGVITEATVRLRARPEADETVVVTLPTGRDALGTLLSTIRTAAIEPLAAELLSAVRAQRCGLGGNAVMLVRLAGNTTAVHHQRATLAKLAACELAPDDVWANFQRSDPESAIIVRVSRRPTELARLWSTASSLPDVDAHATLSRGIVRLRLPGDTPLEAFEPDDRQVFERGARRAESAAPIQAISRRLRDAFDPERLLNRGILGAEAP